MGATSGPAALPGDSELLNALQSGDETAFAGLVDAYSPALLGVAMAYVRNRSLAEELVEETWMRVIRGLPGLEGRFSLRAWIFRILANTAITRPSREAVTVRPARTPGEGFLTSEPVAVIAAALEELPAGQRAVITLRDVEGWPAEAVCDALEVSPANQRVLLHGARATVSAALEREALIGEGSL